MKLFNLRVNYINNPLGYDFSFLTFSWQAESKFSCFSSAVRLTIWTDSDKIPCYDTGVMKNFRENRYYVKLSLNPRTRYYWKVWIEGNGGDEEVSETAWFETGKLTEEWKGRWISAANDSEQMPVIYKEFTCAKKLKRARLYLCGVGLYEAYLNGKKLGKEYLQPGYHSYDLRMEYQTIDLTEKLVQGHNVLGLLLGEGWYKGRFGFDGDFRNLYGEKKKCIAELYLEYGNKTTECIVTDGTWKAVQSHVLQNSIYDGEWIDDTVECQELKVEVLKDETRLLTERTNPPIRKTECLAPVAETWQPDGTLLLDFGEMLTGWVEWSGTLQYGQKICLQYGEILQNNQFYRDNLRTAKAEFIYVSDGTEKLIRPHFTYYGFRYVRIDGLEKGTQIVFRAYRLMSDIQQTGWITTSNEKVNRLVENTRRSQKCNFLDIPTDCPQRDERMGWTGDVAVFAATACFHEDCTAFFRHYAKSLAEEEKLMGGAVPFFSPRAKIKEREGINPFYSTGGVCGWGDVATILPWTLYCYYGDKQLLAEQYPMMCDWVDYMTAESKNNPIPYLWQTGRQLGDWLALDNGNINNPIGRTDVQLLASAYYYYSTKLCGCAAKVLCDSRAEELKTLKNRIKDAFVKYYFDVTGEVRFDPTQTACALLLQFGLYPENGRRSLEKNLKEQLVANNGLLNTGFLGTPVLFPALSENEMNDMAYSLLLNESYPGWLYEINLGATSVWERWNSLEKDGTISGTGMNSLNHYAYGSVAEWMYKYMCGFLPQMGQEICMLLRPMPDMRFANVEGCWQSIYGKFVSGWSYDQEKGFHYHFTIPFNVKAKVIFPNGRSTILECGNYYFDEQGKAMNKRR